MIDAATYVQLGLQGWVSGGQIVLTFAYSLFYVRDFSCGGRVMPLLWLATALVLAGQAQTTISYMFLAISSVEQVANLANGPWVWGRFIWAAGVLLMLTWFWRYFRRGVAVTTVTLCAILLWTGYYIHAVRAAHL